MNLLNHIHRKSFHDELWYVGNRLIIDDSYLTNFYIDLLKEEKALLKRYKSYDIDYIIAIMEDMKFKNLVSESNVEDFDILLKRYYFLRREWALEEGRKMFNSSAPSRLHSIFLCDNFDLDYWISVFELHSFDVFSLELDGNLFTSSDSYFSDKKLKYDIQVEKSKFYWQPKKLTFRREYLFQGNLRIVSKK